MKENAEDEEVIRLLEQLQESRSQRVKEQRKISELEEQLAGLLQVKKEIEGGGICKQPEADTFTGRGLTSSSPGAVACVL